MSDSYNFKSCNPASFIIWHAEKLDEKGTTQLKRNFANFAVKLQNNKHT